MWKRVIRCKVGRTHLMKRECNVNSYILDKIDLNFGFLYYRLDEVPIVAVCGNKNEIEEKLKRNMG